MSHEPVFGKAARVYGRPRNLLINSMTLERVVVSYIPRTSRREILTADFAATRGRRRAVPRIGGFTPTLVCPGE